MPDLEYEATVNAGPAIRRAIIVPRIAPKDSVKLSVKACPCKLSVDRFTTRIAKS